MKQPDKQYRIAATGKFDAAVAYYGGGIQQHHGVADQVTQPILFHDAGQDTHIPQCAVAECDFVGRTNATSLTTQPPHLFLICFR